jgi:probable rRNA maturation factor
MASLTSRRRPALQVDVSSHVRTPIVTAGLGAWLQDTAPRSVCGIVSIAIVSDARVRSLNREYRGVDSATDVLSFPSNDDSTDVVHPDESLGDIVIAAGVARRQAAAAGHAVAIELRVLALHGLLHLAGHDHETDGGAMAALERKLRRQGGLIEGLIERAHRPLRQRRERRA